MSKNSRRDGETLWREIAVELVNEKDPSKLVRLAQELNKVLEKQRIASKEQRRPDARP